jgi:hypothetical protein
LTGWKKLSLELGELIMAADDLLDSSHSDTTVKIAGPSHPIRREGMNLEVHWFSDPATGESWGYKFV